MKPSLLRFKLPFLLLLLLAFTFLFGGLMPVEVKAFFYAVSLTLKAVLFALLPFVIFSFLFSSIISLQNGVITFVLLLLGLVYLSNFTAILTAASLGHVTLSLLHFPENYQMNLNELVPLWQFSIPKLIPNEVALITGLVAGVLCSLYPTNLAYTLSQKLNLAASLFLRQFFLPLLPLFIFGFILKIQHEGMLEKAVMIYGSVLFVVVSLQVTYVSLLYLIAAKFSLKQWWEYVRNVLPAGLTGFSTMSSAAALPLSIIAAEQNTKNPELARAIAPASVNIHTLGSAIAMTTIALATLLTFDMPLPGVGASLMFAAYYAIAKYAVAGVPGGAIFIAVPLLESQLGFTSEMSGMLTAVYMFFDPFGTATNVFGNGAFAIIFSKLFVRGREGFSEKEVMRETAA